jgi:hypothetical protein
MRSTQLASVYFFLALWMVIDPPSSVVALPLPLVSSAPNPLS